MSSTITDDFRAQFTGDIVTPADGAVYDAAIQRWAKNAARNAAVVVYPKSNADVALALTLGLPVAIRGGGHSASGASSIEGGLVIDLSRYFAGVRVDAENKVAFCGGGSVWRTVDEEAIKYGLATVGGTVNHTGVGGLALGGGYGWLTGRHGLVVDNIVQATVVTASGKIVTASETENTELLNALRGGGCNFGIVTEFGLRLHHQRPTVYAGMIIYPGDLELLDPLRNALATWWAQASEDEAALFVITGAPDGGPPVYVVLAFYNGGEEEGKKRFKPFLDLNPFMNTLAEVPYEKLNGIQNDGFPPGSSFYMKGAGIALDDLLEPGDTRLRAVAEIVRANHPHAGALLECFPLRNVIRRDPHGAHAFRGRATNNMAFIIQWKEGDDQERVGSEAPEVARRLAAAAGDEGISYGNYDDNPSARNEEKARHQFSDAYERLQRVKAKYDPGLRFDRWFPIVPKA